MKITAAIVSNRKQKRKLYSPRRLEEKLRRKLVLESRQAAKSGVQKRIQEVLAKEGRTLSQRTRPQRGDIIFSVKFPGFVDAAGEKVKIEGSWLQGEAVTLEVSQGWVYRFRPYLKSLFGENFDTSPVEQTPEQKKLSSQQHKLARRLKAAVRGTVYEDTNYKRKVKDTTYKILKEISLADL